MLSSLSRQLGLRARAAAAAGGGGGWAALAAAGALHTSAALAASLQVKIPALGESISDGTVATVLKQAGEQVEEDEAILQIETDKVTVDVRAPRAGVIEAILVRSGVGWEVGAGRHQGLEAGGFATGCGRGLAWRACSMLHVQARRGLCLPC